MPLKPKKQDWGVAKWKMVCLVWVLSPAPKKKRERKTKHIQEFLPGKGQLICSLKVFQSDVLITQLPLVL